jgi:outer membrane protein assembly factor BamB
MQKHRCVILFATQNMQVRGGVVLNGDSSEVYFGSYDSSVYALYTATGAKKWQYKTGPRLATAFQVLKLQVLKKSAVISQIIFILHRLKVVWHALSR